MSYHLSRTEDDTEVKKAVDEVQGVYNVRGKREWVEWVGKTLMPRLHTQIEMERADAMRAEQDVIEEDVRGHPSIFLLPISSPTLHLFICIYPPHRCTILKDHIHS
jgi:hypothetical protein